MNLTASDYKKLKSFYRDEKLFSLRPGKRLRAWLEDHFDVRVINDIVVMDAATKSQIRQLLEQQNPGFNVKAGLPQQADHLTMSKVMLNEKLGSVKPNENYVLLKGRTGKVSLEAGDVKLSPENSLRIPVNQLKLSAVDCLLVVENLDVFDALPHYDIPIDGNVLLVYRGHDKGTSKGLKTLLTQAKDKCTIYWFPDMDPKGLQIALSYQNVTGILAADFELEREKIIALSDHSRFTTQSEAVQSIKTNDFATHPLCQFLLKNTIAVTQQHLISNELALDLFHIKG